MAETQSFALLILLAAGVGLVAVLSSHLTTWVKTLGTSVRPAMAGSFPPEGRRSCGLGTRWDELSVTFVGPDHSDRD